MRFALVAIGCLLAVGLAYSESDVKDAPAQAARSVEVAPRDPTLMLPSVHRGGLSEIRSIDAPEVDAGPLPKDPIQHGDSTLFLSLTDASTDAPTALWVHLWRIDAPGNQAWTRGDQLQAEDHVAESYPCRFKNLPEGRYRVHTDGQLSESKDLPSFVVGPGVSTVSLALPMPRTFPVLVEILDPHGVALTSATYWCDFSHAGESTVRPAWVVPRSRRGRPAKASQLVRESYEVSSHFYESVAIEAERGYFAVGTLSEPSRGEASAWSCTIFMPRYVPVYVGASYRYPRTHLYRATTVPVADVHDVLMLPDGRRAVDAGARIHTSIEAHLDGSEPRLPGVQVVASLKGYKRLSRSLPIGEPWERIEMVPEDTPNPEHNATMAK